MDGTTKVLIRVYYEDRGARLYDDFINGNGYNNGFYLQKQILYSQALVTLPVNTVEAVKQADSMALADCCLLVNVNLLFVGIWEVSDSVGVGPETPVSILHFFEADAEVEGESMTLWQAAEINYQTDGYEPNDSWGNPSWSPWRWDGFESFDLVDSGDNFEAKRDGVARWLVAQIARDCESGKSSKQEFPMCVTTDDFYIRNDGVITLNHNGTLLNTRYALWESIIENLPFAHSGWQLTPECKIRKVERALSERNLNCIVHRAQRERQFLRRGWALNMCLNTWEKCVKYCMAYLYQNYRDGMPEQKAVSGSSYGVAYVLRYTTVPYHQMRETLNYIQEFVNLYGVATGQSNLLLQTSASTDETNNALWENYRWQLSPDGINPDIVTSKGQTRQLEILEAIIFYWYDLVYRIESFQWNLSTRPWLIPETDFESFLHNQEGAIRVYELFAESWPQMQADFLSLLGLLLSFQLTWDFSEPTRASEGEDVMRSPEYPKRPIRRWDAPETPRYTVERAPDLSARFGVKYPNARPFRIHDVVPIRNDLTPLEVANRVNLSRAALAENLAEIEAKRREDEVRRRAEREAEIEVLRNQMAYQDTPNPNDPWDYRNYSSKEWWVHPLSNHDMVEISLRAADTPDEFETVQNAVEMGGHIAASNKRRGGPLMSGVELVGSALMPTRKITPMALKRYVIKVVAGYIRYQVDEYKDKALEKATDLVSANNPPYSERQVFPVFNPW